MPGEAPFPCGDPAWLPSRQTYGVVIHGCFLTTRGADSLGPCFFAPSLWGAAALSAAASAGPLRHLVALIGIASVPILSRRLRRLATQHIRA